MAAGWQQVFFPCVLSAAGLDPSAGLGSGVRPLEVAVSTQCSAAPTSLSVFFLASEEGSEQFIM